jgi:hypothetical protein
MVEIKIYSPQLCFYLFFPFIYYYSFFFANNEKNRAEFVFFNNGKEKKN